MDVSGCLFSYCLLSVCSDLTFLWSFVNGLSVPLPFPGPLDFGEGIVAFPVPREPSFLCPSECHPSGCAGLNLEVYARLGVGIDGGAVLAEVACEW